MLRRALLASLVLALALVGAGCARRDGRGEGETRAVRIAAAADLSLAFADVAREYEARTGTKVELVFGSTGLLAAQIREGAPFDVFAAADRASVDGVVESGACDGETRSLYARGRVVLWAKDASTLPPSLSALREPRYRKIALANPEHAPYGRAGRQALERAGAWSGVEPRMVFGENVRQALQFAETGSADVAFVALSLSVSSGGAYVLVDEALHDPLDQAMVICHPRGRGALRDAAVAFSKLVASPEGRAIMNRYGFKLPGEAELRAAGPEPLR